MAERRGIGKAWDRVDELEKENLALTKERDELKAGLKPISDEKCELCGEPLCNVEQDYETPIGIHAGCVESIQDDVADLKKERDELKELNTAQNKMYLLAEDDVAELSKKIAKAKELLNSNDPPKEFKWKIGAHLCPEWTDKEKAEWEVRRGRFVWAGKDGRKFIVKALEG